MNDNVSNKKKSYLITIPITALVTAILVATIFIAGYSRSNKPHVVYHNSTTRYNQSGSLKDGSFKSGTNSFRSDSYNTKDDWHDFWDNTSDNWHDFWDDTSDAWHDFWR
jgi:hypothetical protein